nr:hypothetical protein BCU41_12145 [Vibrio lentus]
MCLAERTTKATQEVSGIIQSIQSSTQEAVAYTQDNGRLVEIGVEQSTRRYRLYRDCGRRTDGCDQRNCCGSDISEQSLQLATRSSENTSGLNAKVAELEALVGKFKLA